MSRIEKIAKNYSGEVLHQLVATICRFIGRTVFIKTLGVEYLGISGLYTNILTILSLTDLGIGSSIIFSLYKPLHERDTDKIYVLMKLYKKVYRVIGFAVAVLGCALMPFLPYLMKGGTTLVNIYVVYLIYLMQSVMSYLFMAYHASIIEADQKAYVISVITSAIEVVTLVSQVLVLLLTSNYILYLMAALGTNILKNIVIGLTSRRMYPYLKEKREDVLSREETLTIFKNSAALMIYRINSAIMNTCDNIILSAFIGLKIVGLYSNYLIFTTSFTTFLNKMFTSMKASIGDLHAEGNLKKEYQIFLSCNFLAAVIYGTAAVGVGVISNEVLTAWIGKKFIISDTLPILLGISFYLAGIQHINSIFRDAAGLFQQAKYRPLFATIINVILSVLFVKDYGIHGVVAATVCSQAATYLWFDPIIICKYAFKRSAKQYFTRNAAYAAVLVIAGAITWFVRSTLQINIILKIGVEMVVCIISILGFFLLIWGRNEEVQYLKNIAASRLKRQSSPKGDKL